MLENSTNGPSDTEHPTVKTALKIPTNTQKIKQLLPQEEYKCSKLACSHLSGIYCLQTSCFTQFFMVMRACHDPLLDTKGIIISKTSLLCDLHTQNAVLLKQTRYLTQDQTHEDDRVGQTMQITVSIPCNYR